MGYYLGAYRDLGVSELKWQHFGDSGGTRKCFSVAPNGRIAVSHGPFCL